MNCYFSLYQGTWSEGIVAKRKYSKYYIVTGAGIAMLAMEVTPMVGAGVVGFGVTHIVLGSIDLVQHKKHINFR